MIPALITPAVWLAHLKRTGKALVCYADGENVTRRCFRAAKHKDGELWDLWLFRVGADGKYEISAVGELRKDVVVGNIREEAAMSPDKP